MAASTKEKQLLLIRHAKSSWEDFSVPDFDRPLNERGKRDAPVMAQRLLEKQITIDAFIASPAKRASKTAQLFCKEYKREKEEIIFNEQLYLAPPTVFYKVIQELDNSINTAAIFSHNNGITEFANLLTTARIDEIPTCGIFAIKFKSENWCDFEKRRRSSCFSIRQKQSRKRLFFYFV
jgi:phosphohistidine phosphatase